MSSNIFTKIACDLHEIKELSKDPLKSEIVTFQLENLWKNVCHFKRAKEAVNYGCLHSEKVLTESVNEISKIYGAENLRESIILNNN